MNFRTKIKLCLHLHSVNMYLICNIGLGTEQKSKFIHLVHLRISTMLIWLENHLHKIYKNFKKLLKLITDISQLSQSQTEDYTN